MAKLWPNFLVPVATIWLVVWIFCIIRSIQAWLWLIGGREIITVSAEWLCIVNNVYGWRRVRDFELATVGN